MLRVLASDETYGYLSLEAAAVLHGRRVALAGVLDGSRDGVEVADDELRWWTFAGGRINSTLRYALEAAHEGWKVIPDNCLLRLLGEDLTGSGFERVVQRLSSPEFWDDEAIWRKVEHSLPAYRLSKFQPLMPPWVEREVIADYLLDVAGTRLWLQESAPFGSCGRR
ncbi:MAG: hypothetical protein HYY25_10495 [Candidatus Wallbacteria bacterium]|nr:hypothetical protein [Candidatus Wallbacteria bacterium]